MGLKGILSLIKRAVLLPHGTAPTIQSREQIQQLINAALEIKAAEFARLVDERVARAISQRLFKPQLPAMNNDGAAVFMPYSNCSVADMLHPRYRQLCSLILSPPLLHRKMWEWVFVMHHLLMADVVVAGKKGLCFGVGKEQLPALFAGLGASIVATDAPPEVTTDAWIGSGEHAASCELLRNDQLCPNDLFDERVSFRYCDMSAIDRELTGFDFAWSSCCFEHLGSLEAGIQFVINSVEHCLKPGGIGVHTTELNLSSDENTVASGATVLYRRRDIIDLIERLRVRGHDVMPFSQAPDAHVLDFHVDVPPYTHDPHIKLNLQGYVTTSVGIVVRRSLA